MAKGYWVVVYHAVHDPAKLTAYALAGKPVIEGAGGRFLSRGAAAHTPEGVPGQRTTVIEFESVERALATYQSREYQTALLILKGAAAREVRILEGLV